MLVYNIYPSVDATNNFPPPIREAMASSVELTTATTGRIVDVENPVRQSLDNLYLSKTAIIDGGLP